METPRLDMLCATYKDESDFDSLTYAVTMIKKCKQSRVEYWRGYITGWLYALHNVWLLTDRELNMALMDFSSLEDGD